MQPRRLRLGDVVDDYCPRERRLSNHVIVAIVDDTIKQTRCSTCDFEHPYKDGKLPARRAKKDGTSALFKQVLDNVTEGVPMEAEPAAPPVRGVLRPTANGESPGEGADASRPDESRTPAPPAPLPIAARDAAAGEAERDAADDGQPRDEGPVHRTLIRATLPRIESEVPARPIPTFTVREAAQAPKFRRFRPKRGPGGGQPFGVSDNFGNRAGGFKNPQFSAQPGRNHNQKPQGGHPNRGNQTRQQGAHGVPGGQPFGGRRNNQRRNKGPR